MRIGTHVSIAGGIEKAPGNAAAVGAEVFQVFSRSPHGGKPKPITRQVQKSFQAQMDKYKLDIFYIHTPYYINLASVKNNIYFGSVSVIREELERGNKLGCKAVMTHLGSFKDLSEKQGVQKVVSAIAKIMDGYKGQTQLLLENSAGAGKLVGDSFEELAQILHDKKLKKYNIGVCFDTCHAFATGYDVRDKKTVDQTLKQFDRHVGLKHLSMIHANDSKGELGGHLDRHEHIGKGSIGLEGFKALAKHKAFSKLDWILETPKDNPRDDIKNMATLKKFRS
ncbi:MAG: deoxyribonuclease IV [bacterium]|nr:deoxyribonuclease IV [bacterium]